MEITMTRNESLMQLECERREREQERKELISLLEMIPSKKMIDYLYGFTKCFVEHYDKALFKRWKAEINKEGN